MSKKTTKIKVSDEFEHQQLVEQYYFLQNVQPISSTVEEKNLKKIEKEGYDENYGPMIEQLIAEALDIEHGWKNVRDW